MCKLPGKMSKLLFLKACEPNACHHKQAFSLHKWEVISDLVSAKSYLDLKVAKWMYPEPQVYFPWKAK